MRDILEYNPDTGHFTWIGKAGRSTRLGAVAGNINTDGYRRICVRGKRYYAHRLAWWFIYGVWPNKEIDHINLNKDDNRIVNLRLVTRSQNKQNMGAIRGSASALKGAHWEPARKKWRAVIVANGKSIFLGRFKTDVEAAAAYAEAAKLYHTHNKVGDTQ